MQIRPDQVAAETQVSEDHAVIKAVKDAGAQEPKIVLVFDANLGPDKETQPWKVRVFYQSPTELKEARLDVPVVPMDTQVLPEGEDVIKTTYPDGYVGWCGVIGGKPVWIT
jgi:hypothetical protein